MSYFQVITTMLTTGTDDLTLWLLPERQPGHQYRWLAWWVWPRNRTILQVASMVVTWWIVAFLPICSSCDQYPWHYFFNLVHFNSAAMKTIKTPFTLRTMLYGDDNLDFTENKRIITETLRFTIDSKRFVWLPRICYVSFLTVCVHHWHSL